MIMENSRKQVRDKVVVTVPNRLHMFTTRALFNVNNMTGGAGISIDTLQRMSVRIIKDANRHITPNRVLDSFCELLKIKLKFSDHFEVKFLNRIQSHCGYGTTVSQISALCVAINYLFGNLLTDVELRTLIMENYCEQIEDKLIKGLETGVGPVCSLYGGINLVTNVNSYVHLEIPDDILVVTFIPNHKAFKRTISLAEEIGQRHRSYQADEESLEIRNDLIFTTYLPALLRQEWNEVGRVTAKLHSMGLKRMECERYDYDYEMILINELLAKGALVAGLSSLGPVNYFLAPREKIEVIKFFLDEKEYAVDMKDFNISQGGISIIE